VSRTAVKPATARDGCVVTKEVLEQRVLLNPADPLSLRCDDLGLPLLAIDQTGGILDHQVPDGHGLAATVLGSHWFARALTEAADAWRDARRPEPRSLFPGCRAVPMPVCESRRRIGYRVVILFDRALAQSEPWLHIARQAEVDPQVMIDQADDLLLDEPLADRAERMLMWMIHDLLAAERQGEELDTLSQQLAESYEELSLVYKLSAGMTVTRDPGKFIDDALDELQQVVGMKFLSLQLTDGDDRLKSLRGKHRMIGHVPCSEEELTRIGRQLIVRSSRAALPNIIEDGRRFDMPGLNQLGQRMLIVPLIVEERPIGVIVGADKINGAEVSSVDSKLVTSLAQSIAIFLENVMLYDDLQDMFMGTLRAMVNAIDAKDSYTCGHSERVAWLGEQLARAAGMDDAVCQRIHLAGLVHDLGKIGVPEHVLTKPGKLTDDEFAMIKTHPRIGARILQDIRQMQDLIPGVLYHHERYDGRGYPDGVAGDNIPLFGRVLCLADSFDAMSSDRTYRSAMPLKTVLEEIRNCAGAQFDPHLAEVFITLDFDGFYEMLDQHRRHESPLRRELSQKPPEQQPEHSA